jgi:hypothetical protein
VSETPLTPEQARDLAREERRAELLRKSKRQLVTEHHRGAGCLMSPHELATWTKEELANAILESEENGS